MTADVYDSGSVKVTVLDGTGEELGTSTFSKTVTDSPLNDIKKLKGDKIRLRFEIDKAKVYSFSFAK